jgi:hypothetical protein
VRPGRNHWTLVGALWLLVALVAAVWLALLLSGFRFGSSDRCAVTPAGDNHGVTVIQVGCD